MAYEPENDVILAAADQDYERFYEGEIRLRRLRRDPPFSDQFMITVAGEEEDAVRRGCAQVREALLYTAKQPAYAPLQWEILGPAPAPDVKVNNRSRYRRTVIGKNDKTLRSVIASLMMTFTQRRENRSLQIYADCNLMD